MEYIKAGNVKFFYNDNLIEENYKLRQINEKKDYYKIKFVINENILSQYKAINYNMKLLYESSPNKKTPIKDGFAISQEFTEKQINIIKKRIDDGEKRISFLEELPIFPNLPKTIYPEECDIFFNYDKEQK